MPEEKIVSQKRLVMYAVGFLFNLSYAIPTYYNSTFLSHFISEKLVGIIYTASSILAIAAFVEMPGFLKRFGNFKTTVALLSLEMLSIGGLVFGNSVIAIIAAFILNFVSIALINFTIDVFLEEFSSDSRTGKIRGTFMTVANIAWLISPVIAAWLLERYSAAGVYLSSGLLLVPVIILIALNLGGIADPEYDRTPFWKSLGAVWANRNIKGILFVQFLLQFFYAWMIIYTPIYLRETVGFDTNTIGWIFTIMILPFALIEGPLGRLADRNGEKKVMSAGFVIMAASTAVIAFVTDHNAVLWAALLFMTRVGAASVEVMADTYFFKKVNAADTHIISFSRMMRPMAYVVSPVMATILFTTFDMKGLFIFLGLLMLYGLRYTLSITDTKSAS